MVKQIITKFNLKQFGIFALVTSLIATSTFFVGQSIGGNANTGVLPESSGGTGQSTFLASIKNSATGAFSSIIDANLTASRLVASNSSGKIASLSAGTSGQYLQSNGSGTAPSWITPQAPRVLLANGSTSTRTYTISTTDFAKYSAFEFVLLDSSGSFTSIKHFEKSAMVNSSTSANTYRDGLIDTYDYAGTIYTQKYYFTIGTNGRVVTLVYSDSSGSPVLTRTYFSAIYGLI